MFLFTFKYHNIELKKIENKKENNEKQPLFFSYKLDNVQNGRIR